MYRGGLFWRAGGPLKRGGAGGGGGGVRGAGGGGPGGAGAAGTADVVFSVTQDLDEAKAAYADVKNRLPAYGRSADALTILPGVMPVVGRTDREARDKLATLQGFLNATNGLQLLSDRLGQDMTAYDLDGPGPDPPLTESSQAFSRAILAKARRAGITLRDLYTLNSAARGPWVLCRAPPT